VSPPHLPAGGRKERGSKTERENMPAHIAGIVVSRD